MLLKHPTIATAEVKILRILTAVPTVPKTAAKQIL